MYGGSKDCLIIIPFRLPQISFFTLSLKCFSAPAALQGRCPPSPVALGEPRPHARFQERLSAQILKSLLSGELRAQSAAGQMPGSRHNAGTSDTRLSWLWIRGPPVPGPATLLHTSPLLRAQGIILQACKFKQSCGLVATASAGHPEQTLTTAGLDPPAPQGPLSPSVRDQLSTQAPGLG